MVCMVGCKLLVFGKHTALYQAVSAANFGCSCPAWCSGELNSSVQLYTFHDNSILTEQFIEEKRVSDTVRYVLLFTPEASHLQG